MAVRDLILKLCGRIENFALSAQGKGATGTIQREVNQALGVLTTKPKLAVDVGGNVGHYAAELRAQNPDLEIHVFEPQAINVAKLKDRFRDDSLIRLMSVALSSSSGWSTLYSE